jgi:hypothetical protein
VVELGVTSTEPVAPKDPNPGMFTDVALVVLQLRDVLEPELMLIGRAVSTMLGAGLPDKSITLSEPDPRCQPFPEAGPVFSRLTDFLAETIGFFANVWHLISPF